MKLTRFFIILILLLKISCSSNNADKENEKQALQSILLSQAIATSSRTTYPTCESSAPSFSSLRSAGFESSCGSCHNGTYFTATDYTQVKNLTVSGDPLSSKLFQKQSTGTMKIYTTTAIDRAIYCWIKGGSNP